jgi:hypothetical protein
MAQAKLEIDLSAFPPGTVTEYTTVVCLACIFDIFTKQLRMAPRTAYTEIKRYVPSVHELTARETVRPFFDSEEKHPHCPYCGAAKRWLTRLDTYRIEGGKPTDAARRALTRKLPTRDGQFVVIEARSDQRAVFFDWLDTLRLKLDLEDERWLLEAARAFLERTEPRTNWEEVFAEVTAIRRSKLFAEGWERESTRLFLAPPFYNGVLLVQYLVSRSHQHGGLTLEGRLTLLELIRRLRQAGFLTVQGINEQDQFEILEKLVDELAGSGGLKLYHVVDRRDFLDKAKSVYARYAA